MRTNAASYHTASKHQRLEVAKSPTPRAPIPAALRVLKTPCDSVIDIGCIVLAALREKLDGAETARRQRKDDIDAAQNRAHGPYRKLHEEAVGDCCADEHHRY